MNIENKNTDTISKYFVQLDRNLNLWRVDEWKGCPRKNFSDKKCFVSFWDHFPDFPKNLERYIKVYAIEDIYTESDNKEKAIELARECLSDYFAKGGA